MVNNPFSTNSANRGATNAFETSVRGDNLGQEVITLRKNRELNALRNVYMLADYAQYRREREAAQATSQQEVVSMATQPAQYTPENVTSLPTQSAPFRSPDTVTTNDELAAEARRKIEESYGQAA